MRQSAPGEGLLGCATGLVRRQVKVNAPAFWEIFVTYRKVGRLRYLSHLDVARGMERALRRSGLPIRFTKGYHRR
ncbi:MAG: DUF2344 domain-containing protein, partial [Armatimonadota bacterium]